jgi:integrase/recombinase XerD
MGGNAHRLCRDVNRQHDEAKHTWLKFAEAIDHHMLYLATERGLSATYQLATRRVLEDFAKWILAKEGLYSPRSIKRNHLTDYLVARKERGLSPSSMKSIVVALKIFFRLLKVRGLANQDPGEHIRLPKLALL